MALIVMTSSMFVIYFDTNFSASAMSLIEGGLSPRSESASFLSSAAAPASAIKGLHFV